MVPGDVEDQVVAMSARCEIFLGVINDLVGADRSDHVEVPGPANARHVRSERLRDLHPERPHAPRCAVDQHLPPGPDLSFVTKTLEGSDCRHRYRGSLLERHVGRLRDETDVLHSDVLGKRPYAHPEDLIPWVKLGTFLPTASTRPAKSPPGTLLLSLGFNRPY